MLISRCHCHCHHLLPFDVAGRQEPKGLGCISSHWSTSASDNHESQLSTLIRTIQLHQDALICVWNTKEIIRLQYNGSFSFPLVSFVSEGNDIVRIVSAVDVIRVFLTITQRPRGKGTTSKHFAALSGKGKKSWRGFWTGFLWEECDWPQRAGQQFRNEWKGR